MIRNLWKLFLKLYYNIPKHVNRKKTWKFLFPVFFLAQYMSTVKNLIFENSQKHLTTNSKVAYKWIQIYVKNKISKKYKLLGSPSLFQLIPGLPSHK